ncbi:thiol-disulfide oxidoreductase [Maioricimonas rarisocia]|uniref:Thiol-disulfide oxidoreductase n=1 Tax=Maioricimonas rarisocia TaxID=2528026 RepID=A0A517Z649_9PLAN|nr:redoxin domain-containing protein [Maioricimonas rarisocia]QDU37988.1 thiol-disulfide oxidoreductase [Maioricimonas rarisocia]
MKLPADRLPITSPQRPGHPRILHWSVCLAFIAVATCGVASRGLAADPELTVTDWAGVQKRVRAASGKVVVVQIWTMTCPRCREELPEIIERLSTFPQDRLEWIAVNCDYDGIAGKPPAWYQPKILEFLSKHSGPLVHLQLDVPFLDFLEQQDLESTPAFYVYEPGGMLIRRFPSGEEDEFALKDVLRTVHSLTRPN